MMIEVDVSSDLSQGLEPLLHLILDTVVMGRMQGPETQTDEKFISQPDRLLLANGAGRDPGDPSATNVELTTAAWTLPSIMHPMIVR